MDALDRLAAALSGAQRAVTLTGAGISAPSGVPTFRDPGGIWNRFDERDFHVRRFRHDPEGFWRDRIELQDAMYGGPVEPNVAHDALADLAADGPVEAILTQNTDGLHREASRLAGREVLELHGNASRVVCPECGVSRDGGPVFERVRAGTIPPRCDCGAVYKPDVVLFGEVLPTDALDRARRLAAESDVFVAIGTGLTVEPAASLPRLAGRSGATVGVIDRAGTPEGLAAASTAHSRTSDRSLPDVVVEADVVEALPPLRDAILG